MTPFSVISNAVVYIMYHIWGLYVVYYTHIGETYCVFNYVSASISEMEMGQWVMGHCQ